jgi:hypothetical protein
MKLTRIEGFATVCHCVGCGYEAIGGSVPYVSASTEECRQPEEFYTDSESVYCSTCAAKLVQTDSTRSVSRFFTDTAGTQIDSEVLA